MNTTDLIAASWTNDRAYLHAVAARILTDPVEAEDVVQDAFARLALQPIEEIRDVRAWLVVVVRRLALDRLGSAHRRMSSPSDPFDLEVGGAKESGVDPADRITLDDEVRRALGVVLDQLTPAERTAFLLHDVFGVPFARIGELVGRTPGACRQLARRARASIGRASPTSTTAEESASEVALTAERFRAACAGGDLTALIEVLDRDVTGWALVHGRRAGAVEGAEAVAERTLLFLGPDTGWELALVPFDRGMAILATRRAEPIALIRLEIAESRVVALRAIVLPS